jgi:hypothetical protein
MGTTTSIPTVFNNAGQVWNVDPALLHSVATVESGGRTFDAQGRVITSAAGAQGIMQFMPQTAQRYGVDVSNSDSSVYGAAHYLHDLLQQTGGNVPAALQLYNGAPSDPRQSYTGRILTAFKSVNPIGSAQASEAPAASVDVGPSYSPQTPPGQPGSETYNPPGGTSAQGKQGGEGSAAQGGISVTVTAPGVHASDQLPGIFGEKAPPATAAAAGPALSEQHLPGIFGAPPSAPAAPQVGIAAGTGAPGPAAPPPPEPTAPAPAVAAAQPAAAPPQMPPSIPPVQMVSPAQAAPAPQAPTPTPAPGAPAPPPAPMPAAPSWMPPFVQRNVYNPIQAMVTPGMQGAPTSPANNYLMNVPLLQELGAGLVQSGRNVEQTLNRFGNWVGGAPPPDIAAEQAQTAANTAAYRRQYGSDRPAQVAENVGNVLLTAPLLRPIEMAAEGYTAAAPFLQGAGRLARAGRFALPRAAAGAIAGGGTDLLTVGGTGEDRYGTTGALGGAALNVLVPGAGALLRGGREAVTRTADRLGIPLSLGQIRGGTYQRLEQLSRLLPLSGAAKLAARQREAIATMLRQDMGVGGEGHFDATQLRRFQNEIGQRMEAIARRMSLRADPATQRELFDLNGWARQFDDPLGRVPDTPASRWSKAMQHQIETMARRGGGQISGDDFLKFIRKGGVIDRMMGMGDSNIAQYGKRLRGILFRAMERNPSNAPRDVQQFRDTRYGYKVSKTIERAVGHGLTGTEEIRLPGLAQDIRRSFRRFDPAGLRRIQQLAGLIGSTPDVATSGTAENLLMAHPLLTALGVGGTGFALHEFDPKRVDEYLSQYGPEVAAVLAGARASRFGSTLGSRTLEEAQRFGNPLLPRFLGYWAGQRIRDNAQAGQQGRQP